MAKMGHFMAKMGHFYGKNEPFLWQRWAIFMRKMTHLIHFCQSIGFMITYKNGFNYAMVFSPSGPHFTFIKVFIGFHVIETSLTDSHAAPI